MKTVKRTFRLVGIKGNGQFSDFGSEVPKLAHQFLSRLDEIDASTGVEIAIFEPKKSENHLTGNFYVGVIVSVPLTEVPNGMEYIELEQDYVTNRGNINTIGELHRDLLQWSEEKGYKRDLESYIVETYHPLESGVEEVEIYLPIKS